MTQAILGIDIGGTNLVAGMVAEGDGRLLSQASEPTRAHEGAHEIVERVAALAEAVSRAATRAVAKLRVLGVGVGAPGPLDTATGTVLLSPNLGWKDLPLRDMIAARLGLPTTLDNDANCAILGEWWQGAARGTRHAIGLTIGTGIGGGIVVDGRLYHGASDCAGEFGHMTIDPAGRRCKCGNYGCLEAYASGPAISSRAIEALEAGEDSILDQMVSGDRSVITAQTVYQAADEGDRLASEVVRETARYLGAGIANLINALNPEVVVVCGGVTRAGDHLFTPLRREVARRAFRPALAATRIIAGELGNAAGVFGAVAAFQQHYPSRVSQPYQG